MPTQRPRWARATLSRIARAIRWLNEPLLRFALRGRDARVAAAEAEVAALRQEVASLSFNNAAMRNELLATNHRISWIEETNPSQKQAPRRRPPRG